VASSDPVAPAGASVPAPPAAPVPAVPPPPPPTATPPTPTPTPPPAAAPSTTPSSTTPAGHDDELAQLLAAIQEEGQLEGDISAPELGASLTKPTDVSRPARVEAAVIDSEGGIDFDPSLAGFGQRAIGLLVDLVILCLWMVPGIALILTGSTAFVLLGLGLMAAGFLAATAIYARAVSARGKSLGNRVAGTTVVDARNGRMIGTGEAGLRYAIRFLVSIVFFIGFFIAFGDSQRRTFHDKVAGTVVIRPPRATWSIDDEISGPPIA
jgi:uncharacterized RDD family membrane protein YckC